MKQPKVSVLNWDDIPLSEKKIQLIEFMNENLSFAFYGNVNVEYSEEEFQLAKKSIEPFSIKFKELDAELLIQSFACVIRHIKYVRDYFDKAWTNESMKEKGASWKQYHEMIYEFNRVLQSFTYEYKGKIVKGWGETFPINKIIFKGNNTGQEIILEGHILEIVKGIFNAFSHVYGKTGEQKMKDFSFDFYKAYVEFMKEWSILNTEEETLVKRLIKNREEPNKQTAFIRYRNQTAFNVYIFLKKYDKSRKIVSEWHKKFIGELFISCGIAHDEKKKGDDKNETGYIDTSNYNTVRLWIERGRIV